MSRCTLTVDQWTLECKGWANEAEATCVGWADQAIQECVTWADQGTYECSQWADQGSYECSQWADEGHKNCCDWWPCSWACDAWYWVSEWVCKGWYWVANWVCQAWYWVAKWVCVGFMWVVKSVCVAWFWIVKAVCTIWSWVAKTVCLVWDNIRCWTRAALWAVVSLLSKTTRRRRRIEHVFVLMLENRSFDHMLGFSGLTGRDARTGAPTTANDLTGSVHSNADPGPPAVTVPAAQGADFKIPPEDKDPGHEFDHAVEQLAGLGAQYPDPNTGSYPPVDNSGFVASYRGVGSAHPDRVMLSYRPDQLPVLNALAREFAVCDDWFCSMPGPTWPNRFFVHAASSGGLDDSPSGFEVATSSLIDGYRFDNGTIFDRLEDRCLGWEVFEGDEFPQVFAISGMNLYALEGHFTDFEEFESELQERNFGPSYVFIEPHYGNILPWTSEDYTCGTSQHPLDDVTRGERLIKQVYEAIRNSPHWERSLLIITWDEHGGFYDHVPPPSTVHPGDTISDEDNDHHGFDFRQLGVRVPAVVVSPLIPRGTIDHRRYDHTSVLATVERIFGFRSITARDAQANDLLHLLSLDAARGDAPMTLPEPADSGFSCVDGEGELASSSGRSVGGGGSGRDRHDGRGDERGGGRKRRFGDANTSLAGFLHVAFLKRLSLVPRDRREERRRLVREFLEVRTGAEARAYIESARQELRSRRTARVPRRRSRIRGSDNR